MNQFGKFDMGNIPVFTDSLPSGFFNGDSSDESQKMTLNDVLNEVSHRYEKAFECLDKLGEELKCTIPPNPSLQKLYDAYEEASKKNPFDPLEKVNHPQHYQSNCGFEAIDVIEAFELNFNLGNVVKYVLREDRKNGLEDLKKALWYLEREIQIREESGNDTQV